MTDALCKFWRAVRTLAGDDAYERYLEHRRSAHAGESAPPLDRRAFFKEEQRRKWEGVRRCC